jgi:hypothetical protein
MIQNIIILILKAKIGENMQKKTPHSFAFFFPCAIFFSKDHHKTE